MTSVNIELQEPNGTRQHTTFPHVHMYRNCRHNQSLPAKTVFLPSFDTGGGDGGRKGDRFGYGAPDAMKVIRIHMLTYICIDSFWPCTLLLFLYPLYVRTPCACRTCENRLGRDTSFGELKGLERCWSPNHLEEPHEHNFSTLLVPSSGT